MSRGDDGQKLHTLPGVNNGNTVINDHITTLDRAVGDQREVGVALLESDGPVDKVQLIWSVNVRIELRARTYVKVVELELSKASIQGSLDDLGAVLTARN